MSLISVQRNLLDYTGQARLHRGQEGFTLGVNDPTLRFQPETEKGLGYLVGNFGITHVLHCNEQLFVWFDGTCQDADLDETIAIVQQSAEEYLEQYRL